jgi:hypothetical protein
MSTGRTAEGLSTRTPADHRQGDHSGDQIYRPFSQEDQALHRIEVLWAQCEGTGAASVRISDGVGMRPNRALIDCWFSTILRDS